MVGLRNVSNTAPSYLPVSAATQSALNLTAPLSNPSFTQVVNILLTLHVTTSASQDKPEPQHSKVLCRNFISVTVDYG